MPGHPGPPVCGIRSKKAWHTLARGPHRRAGRAARPVLDGNPIRGRQPIRVPSRRTDAHRARSQVRGRDQTVGSGVAVRVMPPHTHADERRSEVRSLCAGLYGSTRWPPQSVQSCGPCRRRLPRMHGSMLAPKDGLARAADVAPSRRHASRAGAARRTSIPDPAKTSRRRSSTGHTKKKCGCGVVRSAL